MNILIFSWRGPGHPNAGGAEISTHEHAKGWVRAGHNVTLFTSMFVGAKDAEVVDGVNIIRHGRQIFGVQWEAFKWYLFGNHSKFDLVIDQFHGIPFFTPLYVREKKLGFIHEVTKEVWKLNPWPKPFNLIPYTIGTIFEPLVISMLYKKIPFMTVSNSTKKDLEDWGIKGKDIFIVHNGANNKHLKDINRKEKKTTITYLGAISKDKGIEDALKVFSLLKQKNNDFQFWVIGKSDTTYLSYLNIQVKQLGIEDNIKFWGYVSEDQKNSLLARSYLLINPSIREGWGLVVIEAARMGTPTVGYNVPGLRDSIKNNETGILSNEISSDSLVLSILSLVDNKKEYDRLQKNAIAWSNSFSWDKATKASLNLVEKITG